ncbi:phenylalanyl-tRNA synthetase alpha chain [Candidatus Photodesmus blepharus]|uniref:Serine--tRNA ligase n=1 Tax=Candidatus Photodesmus blepharonis TaxID=1179155 RepID=A0A084CMB6_9GAMM|nr:serine--tRNA ligase [Candidatus Photodesmus blepharus]KEY90945.1 phenylalanyl-tRNA synthetase alpha chain [Candidatus Photodesmus blepharus]
MLDPKLFRNELNETAVKLARRGFELDIKTIRKLEEKRKQIQSDVENFRFARNSISKKIAKKIEIGVHAQESYQEAKKQISVLDRDLEKKQAMLVKVQNELEEIMLSVPNLPDNSVPSGRSENDNVEVFYWGKPKFNTFKVKDHVDLGERYNRIDFASATKISGARFVVMRGQFARLHRAVAQFMLDLHTTKHGYEEVYVPYLVNSDSLFGTGQLPKFNKELFHAETEGKNNKNSRRLSLIPTAEVSVTNIVRDSIIDEIELPIKMTAHTPCFRSEAGSYGRDTRGLIRMHQFDKVELVQITQPENSMDALEELTNHAEKVLQLLELPYRKIVLCAGDMGFSVCKTYDLEVWIPAQKTYREVSSCSNAWDFQARRMKTRFRRKGKKTELVHTLNGSGLAVGRTMVSILENNQKSDGSIAIPEALQSYMGGETLIG